MINISTPFLVQGLLVLRVFDGNNAAWPSTNNVNDKNQTAAIVDVNKKKDILIHLHVMDRLTIKNITAAEAAKAVKIMTTGTVLSFSLQI